VCGAGVPAAVLSHALSRAGGSLEEAAAAVLDGSAAAEIEAVATARAAAAARAARAPVGVEALDGGLVAAADRAKLLARFDEVPASPPPAPPPSLVSRQPAAKTRVGYVDGQRVTVGAKEKYILERPASAPTGVHLKVAKKGSGGASPGFL